MVYFSGQRIRNTGFIYKQWITMLVGNILNNVWTEYESLLSVNITCNAYNYSHLAYDIFDEKLTYFGFPQTTRF